MAKIRKDKNGIYAQIGGWICRPGKNIYAVDGIKQDIIHRTKFKEGEKVRGTHPAGHLAYLRIGKRGTPDYHMEAWEVVDLAPEFKREYEEWKDGDFLTADIGESKVDMSKFQLELTSYEQELFGVMISAAMRQLCYERTGIDNIEKYPCDEVIKLAKKISIQIVSSYGLDESAIDAVMNKTPGDSMIHLFKFLKGKKQNHD